MIDGTRGADVQLGSRDPATTWQYAERYLGGGTRSYSPYSADLEISTEFHPQHGAPRFVVPTFRIGPRQGSWLTNGIASSVAAAYCDGETMLLPVHPETLAVPDLHRGRQLRQAESGPPIEVVPSANARTVFVERVGGQAVPPHFLKLHYPKRLSRFTRRLRRPIIALQLWVADELHRVGTPFLPEVAGGVLGADPTEAWGFLVRESRVRHEASLPYTLPLLALYGHDLHAPSDPTLLEQLVAHSGEDAGTWLARHLVEPMITLWCDVLRRTGCALELHGQNTLVLVSGDFRDTRVAVRDCAVYVDPAIRAARGLTGDLPPRNVISHDVRKPRAQVLSLVYDTFLGAHTLSYLARLARDRLGVEPEALHRHAQRAFAACIGSPDLLPATVYNYDSRLHPDGGWELVDTGASPQWR